MKPDEELFKGHILEQKVDSEEVKVYRMWDPAQGGINHVSLIFLPWRTIITGDYTPGLHGVVSSGGHYGLEWFSGELAADYLSSKFLGKCWTYLRAEDEGLKTLKGYLEAGRCAPAVHSRFLKVANRGYISPCDNGQVEWVELWEEILGGHDDEPPGYGYDLNQMQFLVNIQAAFRRLYLMKVDANSDIEPDIGRVAG